MPVVASPEVYSATPNAQVRKEMNRGTDLTDCRPTREGRVPWPKDRSGGVQRSFNRVAELAASLITPYDSPIGADHQDSWQIGDLQGVDCGARAISVGPGDAVSIDERFGLGVRFNTFGR